MSIEQSISYLSQKNSSNLQSKANNLAKRFHRPYDHSLREKDSSRHGLMSSSRSMSARQLDLPTHNMLLNGSMKSDAGHESILHKVIDHADAIRYDVERLQAGLSLLTHSMERLHEVIVTDTTCCGQSSLWITMQQSIGLSPPLLMAPKNSGDNSSSGYALVNHASIRDDSDNL